MVIICLEKKTLWLEDGDSPAPHQTEYESYGVKINIYN